MGRLEHERAHDSTLSEKRGGLLTIRGLRVISHRLRMSGECDVVEFRADENGVELHGRDGKWLPMPVEYKHGTSRENDADRLQLCAQAMALEEMLACDRADRCSILRLDPPPRVCGHIPRAPYKSLGHGQ